MSVYYYDKAILAHIKSSFPNTIIASYEKILEISASKDESENLPTLPVVGLWNTKWNPLPGNHQATYRGTNPNRATPNGPTYFIKRLPLNLTYSLDIVSNTKKETWGIAAELIWFLTDFPTFPFRVTKPYQFDILEASIKIADVNDSFEVTEFKDTGVIYRTTLDLEINDAYLFNVAVPNAPAKVFDFSIEVEVEMHPNTPPSTR